MRENNTKIAPRSATMVHIGHRRATRGLHKIFARTELRERRHSAVTTADTYVSVFRQMAAAAARASAELLLFHARIRLSLEGAAQA
jgi:hypothetical protein